MRREEEDEWMMFISQILSILYPSDGWLSLCHWLICTVDTRMAATLWEEEGDISPGGDNAHVLEWFDQPLPRGDSHCCTRNVSRAIDGDFDFYVEPGHDSLD